MVDRADRDRDRERDAARREAEQARRDRALGGIPKPVYWFSIALAVAIVLSGVEGLDGKYPSFDVSGLWTPEPEPNETRCLPRCHRDGATESELVWRIRGWKWQNGTVANVGRWREETVAILRELGDGDILAAAGREVLVTKYSSNLTSPAAQGSLCRIANVSRAQTGLGHDVSVKVLKNVTLSNFTCMHETSDPPVKVLLTWLVFSMRFAWAYVFQVPPLAIVFCVVYKALHDLAQRLHGSRLYLVAKQLLSWMSLSIISI
jgi:hypothetical protein